MPLISSDNYKPPFWLFNSHAETIFAAICRNVTIPNPYSVVTVPTSDGDFIELDYYNANSEKTLIISHGLEGNSRRPYVLGMAKAFLSDGWNVMAWNYRGCNGQPNRTIKSYHSGFTDDLKEVIRFADLPKVNNIVLAGFSLGGNMTLKYLSENHQVNDKVKCAVTFSVPLDLHGSCLKISEWSNYLYEKRFLKSLKRKVAEKALMFQELDTSHLQYIHDLKSFDDHYTAPLHGFVDALDYYKKCSALYSLNQIKIPTLIINAYNDPFLNAGCFPLDTLINHPFIHLCLPQRGGHVGFVQSCRSGRYWSETKALEFVNSME